MVAHLKGFWAFFESSIHAITDDEFGGAGFDVDIAGHQVDGFADQAIHQLNDLFTGDLLVAFFGGLVFAFVDLKGVVFFGFEDVKPAVVFVAVFFFAAVEDGIDEVSQEALEAVVVDGKGMDVFSFNKASDIIECNEVLEIDESDSKDTTVFRQRKDLVFGEKVAGDKREQCGIKDDACEVDKGGLFERAFAEELDAEGVGDGLLDGGMLEGELFESGDGDSEQKRRDLGARSEEVGFVEEGGFKVDLVTDSDLGAVVVESILLFAEGGGDLTFDKDQEFVCGLSLFGDLGGSGKREAFKVLGDIFAKGAVKCVE